MRVDGMKMDVARMRHWTLAWVVGAALVLSGGCEGRSAVKDIVETTPPGSDLALPSPEKATLAEGAGDADTAKSIDQYIVEHPDQKAANASLRIRQATIYLNQKQFNLAAAAFDAADRSQLFTDRDQALKELSPQLLWWYQTADKPNIPGAEMARAEDAMQALEQQIAKRQRSPEIRDYLSEMRAWIGLKYFAALADRGKQKAVIEDTINEYAVIFTPADLGYLCAPGLATEAVELTDERKRARAGPIIKQAAQYAKELKGANRPAFKEPVMQDLIAPASANPQCTGK